MAEPVTGNPPSAGGGTAAGAVSTPVSTPVATPPTETPKSTAEYFKLTGEPEAPTTPEPGAQAGAEGEADSKPEVKPGETAGEQKAEGETEEPLSPVEVSEEMKAHFKDPKVGKELKDAFYSNRAFREQFQGGVAEAREYKTLAPSVEDLRGMQESHVRMANIDQLLFSPNSEDHRALINELHKSDPQTTGRLFQSIPQLQLELDPEGFQADTTARFENVLGYFYQKAMSGMNDESLSEEGRAMHENVKNACDVISQTMFNRFVSDPRPEPHPAERQLARERGEAQQRQTQQEVEARKGFNSRIDQEAYKVVSGSINDLVDRMLKVDNIAIPAAIREHLARDIFDEVSNSMLGSAAVRATLLQMVNSDHPNVPRYSDQHAEQILNYLKRQSNLAVLNAARKHVPRYTKDILDGQQARVSKQQQAAARVDIDGGGAPGAVDGDNFVRGKDVDWGKTSTRDFFLGTAVKKA